MRTGFLKNADCGLRTEHTDRGPSWSALDPRVSTILKNTLNLNACSGVLVISSSDAPIMDRLVFGLKSTTLCQALCKADAVCIIESQDPCSTRSSEIEQHNNRDATVKSIVIHEKLCRLLQESFPI